MAITRIKGSLIENGSIEADDLEASLAALVSTGGGPKIANVQIANSSYGVLDDTAVGLDGGYIVITGSGFANGCQVLVNSNNATSVTFVNSTTIRAQVAAADAGTRTVYVVNTDGGTAIRVNGLTYSATPTWVTGSTLPEGGVDESISIQLDASSATSYQLQTGSSLPAGLSLAANGLLSGTVTGIEEETTYNFIVEAIDAENQESPRSFSITITSGDEYFYATTLLLNGDGTNGANNNTFVDSSTNNFAITRNGNPTQGTFSPFSAPDGRWSNYFDGNGDYLSAADNAALEIGASSFCIEAWVYLNALPASGSNFTVLGKWNSSAFSYIFQVNNNSGTTRLSFSYSSDGSSATDLFQNASIPANEWHHIAVTRDSTTLRFFLDGVQQGSNQTVNVTFHNNASDINIGRNQGSNTNFFNGYISNCRLVIGSSVYTSSFIPSTTPLTAITNTSLLTCQSNRFKDNSTNNFAITRNGDVKVTSFSPFAPTGLYSAATNGGSGYFDGSGDNLTFTGTSSTVGSGDFTIEFWYYPTAFQNFDTLFSNTRGASGFNVGTNASASVTWYSSGTSQLTSGTLQSNAWNHIAFTRTSNTLRLYVNGTQTGSTPTVSTNFSDTGYVIGDLAPTLSEPANGYISGLRVVTESLASGSTYTVPTAPPTAITNTSLLLNFTNGGIIDYTGKNNLETVGNAQISTSVKKYGTGSMYFDGSGDYLSIPDSNELHFGSGDFTAECWVHPTASPSQPMIMGQWDGVGGGTGLSWEIMLSNNSSRFLRFALSTDGSGVLTDSISSSALTLNDWNHIALVRSGNVFTAYLNGTSAVTYTITAGTALYNATNKISVGASSTGTQAFQGYIDDLRITKGIARYTSNFTPPDSAHRLR